MTREEALYRVKGYLTDIIPTEDYNEIEEIMTALKQEPCDCISREQAKTAIRDRFKDLPSRVEINTILNDLPSVTPSYNSIKTELKSCEDCISRQAVLDVIEREEFKGGAISEIEKLSSVIPQPKIIPIAEIRFDDDELHKIAEEAINNIEIEPKTGRWILADEQNKEDVENDNYRFICSECQCSDIHAEGTIVPYCWKCGARMLEGSE